MYIYANTCWKHWSLNGKRQPFYMVIQSPFTRWLLTMIMCGYWAGVYQRSIHKPYRWCVYFFSFVRSVGRSVGMGCAFVKNLYIQYFIRIEILTFYDGRVQSLPMEKPFQGWIEKLYQCLGSNKNNSNNTASKKIWLKLNVQRVRAS